MEQFLPEDMKNLTPEEIEERINKTLSEANAPKDVSITNKDILRDEYDTIKELLANKYFGLCSDVTLENHRVKFLESVSEICNTVKEFEENVIKRENSEVIEERLGKVFKLSLKHFIYPFFSSIFIPNFLSAFKCKSIGLDPIAHPPG